MSQVWHYGNHTVLNPQWLLRATENVKKWGYAYADECEIAQMHLSLCLNSCAEV